MNFEWSDEHRAFRQEIRDFLAENLPDDWWDQAHHGPGSHEQTHFSRKFCGKLAEAGLLIPHWSTEWGGAGRDAWCQTILAEEMWAAGEPRGAQYMNVNWIGPTLMRYASAEQRERYLPPIARGDAIWCQGFSEPDAGSDLASLRTRAVRDGDNYRIEGQKIWTSYAGLAETCFLLARTSPDRKTGISVFLVPMDTPGIDVRSIPSLIGEGDIHEVFFDDVVVPASARLAEEGQAWEIAAFSLNNERLGIPRYMLARKAVDRAVEILKERGQFDNALVRARAAETAALCEAARLDAYGLVDQRARGIAVGTEASSARVATVMCERAAAEFVVEFLPETIVDGGDPLLKAHHQRGIVAGIASGAAEIQLNIVASDVLKLPRGPR
ncbi:acyl-CoA dehydrogenase [Sphingosinithalassobacter tenebrarum]|uniref:Acyl-CoA dehydrogenase n=2 Tax=Stakelama tenebrarum TaxID=2711215 RepID=A0A6G6YAV2_9SPHN|nr:acyl-CoA dehydrogenase [Sphingosinithalassobacter tenebrarum]